MRGGGCAGAGIGEQQRHAIGGLDRQRHPLSVANDDVCGTVGARRCCRALHDHVAAVDLPRAAELSSLDANRLRDLAPGLAAPAAAAPSSHGLVVNAWRAIGCRASQTSAHRRGARNHVKPSAGRGSIIWNLSTIVGLGFDATDIDCIAATLELYGDWFRQRIFTSGGIAYCIRRRVPAIHFAGRFAAKEAAMKALGTGHSRGVLWRDIEVVRHGGPPQLVFHGGAGRRLEAVGRRSSLLTITGAPTLAMAQVLILGG